MPCDVRCCLPYMAQLADRTILWGAAWGEREDSRARGGRMNETTPSPCAIIAITFINYPWLPNHRSRRRTQWERECVEMDPDLKYKYYFIIIIIFYHECKAFVAIGARQSFYALSYVPIITCCVWMWSYDPRCHAVTAVCPDWVLIVLWPRPAPERHGSPFTMSRFGW